MRSLAVSHREAWLSALGVFALALVVRVLAAQTVVFPIPEDTAYYYGVARNLVEGRGLVSDALWSYATPPLVLPRSAFEIWLPLPTLLIAPPMAIAGSSDFRTTQVVPVLVGALVPVLAWRLAADVAAERGLPLGRARTLALGVGVTAALELPLVLHSALPDSTMLFAALALGAALLIERIVRDPAGRGAAHAGGAGPAHRECFDFVVRNRSIPAKTRGVPSSGAATQPAEGSPADGHPAEAQPATVRLTDPRLIALGVLLGLTALTRNEAVWLALTWAAIAWTMPPRALGERVIAGPGVTGHRAAGREAAGHEAAGRLSRAGRLRLITVPAAVALAVYAPWAIRDWAVFGSPFPGQAVTNALFLTGFDVFAYRDPPTLGRYLAQGWPSIVQAHVGGLTHNLVSVLLVPSFPVGLIGLVALPRTAVRNARALRPLLLVSTITFLATSLAFPVATTWGTFLHAAGPVHVLLLVSCLLALDTLISRIGRIRGWTRPVAWLGPALTASIAALFSLSIAGFGAQSADVARRYAALTPALERIGADHGRAGPVITDFPIWFAESQRAPALGLPDEPPASVLALARQFGARYLVMSSDDRGIWPAVLESSQPGAECFRPVPLQPAVNSPDAAALAGTRIWEIVCR